MYINSDNVNNIKIEVKTISEYEQLVPPLTLIELYKPTQSIKESSGNIIPILVNREGIIVDGHASLDKILSIVTL
jgi:hypothetical protein